MKKIVVPIVIIVTLALFIGFAYAIDMNRMESNKPVVFSTWGYDYSPPEIVCYAKAPETNSTAFLATVLEEDTTYMLVEPDKESNEYKCSDKIRIEYGTDHIDYLYGIGRKVVIYYSGFIMETYPAIIKTDDISTEGFRDFEISAVKSEESTERFVLKDGRDVSLFYCGLDEVNITVNSETLPLEQAIKKHYVTLDALVAYANNAVRDGKASELIFEDGGSILYNFDNYAILKHHSRDGNRDVHIKSTSYKFKKCKE